MALNHFCTCQDLKCTNHPQNHQAGCDLCVLKNLKCGEIPACFFRAVSNDLGDVKKFTFEGFVEFYRRHHPKSDS